MAAELGARPCGAHEACRGVLIGAEQEMPDFVGDGATEQLALIDSIGARHAGDEVPINGGQVGRLSID